MNRISSTSDVMGSYRNKCWRSFETKPDLNYETVDGEERWTSVGHSKVLRVLVVIWTMRGESIRPVTAFGASKQLTQQYMLQKGW